MSARAWSPRADPPLSPSLLALALRRNMAVNCSDTRLNISWMAVELPTKVAANLSPRGGMSQMLRGKKGWAGGGCLGSTVPEKATPHHPVSTRTTT